MMTKFPRITCLTVAVLALAAPAAHAAFFNDVKRTFQTDVPHFFQDDIPCAFGGQPTSHTKTSCKSNGQAASGRPSDPASVPLRGEPPAGPNITPAPPLPAATPPALPRIAPKPFQY